MRVKCLAQEHNPLSWPGLKPGLPVPAESSALTIRPLCLPFIKYKPRAYHQSFTVLVINEGVNGGGGLPFEREGDSRLAWRCKFQILVSLRVFLTKCHYF